MKENIDKVIRSLWIEYLGVWMLAALVVLIYEADWLAGGVLAGNARACYAAGVTGVLSTVILIPVALRLHRDGLRKCLDEQLPASERLARYHRLCVKRLVLLALPLAADLWIYYATIDQAGLLCAGMVAVSLLFCVPGRGRLLADLDRGGKEGSDA